MKWDIGPLRQPGLFITATDTGVGKTVITCAIAAALRRQGFAGRGGRAQRGARVGVCKPFASGCRVDREGLVSEDAEALAHFADCRQPLSVINPIHLRPALSPAAAAEVSGEVIDPTAVARSLRVLEETSDIVLVEGVGGVLVPLDPADPRSTVLDLIVAVGYPVVVVCRALLGTLNHTAMTVRLLQQAGAPVAGLVLNGFVTDSSPLPRDEDRAMTTNRPWLMKMTGLPILATVPQVTNEPVRPEKGQIPGAILDTVALTNWWDVAEPK